MDLIGGALPNVMFIVGVIAVGIGIGLEFKIVEIKGQLSRRSRYGALGMGAALIAASVFLYTRPPAPSAAALPALGPGAPAAAVSTPIPTLAAIPTAAVAVAPSPAQVTSVAVPDLQGLSAKDAERALKALGLELGKGQRSCDEIGAPSPQAKIDKGKIACQAVPKGSMAPLGLAVDYVLGGSGK